jgi:hypothetical protein
MASVLNAPCLFLGKRSILKIIRDFNSSVLCFQTWLLKKKTGESLEMFSVGAIFRHLENCKYPLCPVKYPLTFDKWKSHKSMLSMEPFIIYSTFISIHENRNY